ncbi:ATP-grasp domain-containing protein [Methanosarcina sp. KYL-1]|uniref:ATP-grasp domain-containing protein n=1 Tax=Methanosarcina sp. KYL-1 TaxID=2602068 RepID=UPI002101A98C|nr:ATP-grasp domain-containing protein [Methanosarcina sp. KYL-1]MCQ1536244.1 ATP-grasp domain-containing protein [Methanosarcina sp. KYL-1]
MIILDEPYVSQILRDTIVEMNLPVLKNATSERLDFNKEIKLLEDAEFIELLKTRNPCKIYSNSEISLIWIADNLGFTGIPEKIDLFKDKLRFRELMEHIYPDFSYQGVEFASLDELDIEAVKKPFIIKPAVGFFSAGVYKVNTGEEWEKVLPALKNEMGAIKGLFPAQVFNSGKFVLEDCIDGPELAVDAYYNSEGKPVVLNILEHLFTSEDDVEDKVYTTSKKTIGTYLEAVTKLLCEINEVAKLPDTGKKDAGLRDFPLHLELRVDKKNRLIPIEVNPIRFAGWCTTDIAYYAYGINVHRYFCEGLEPDWEEILKEKDENERKDKGKEREKDGEKDNRTYCLLIAKKPDDIETEDIEEFDYEGFVSRFEKPLELRKLDFRQYPVFAFLFTETEDSSWGEIERYLRSDLKEFIRIRMEQEGRAGK